MEDEKPPYVDIALLKYLTERNKDKCPEPHMTDREIWMQRGAVGVIRHLQMLYEDQLAKQLGQ